MVDQASGKLVELPATSEQKPVDFPVWLALLLIFPFFIAALIRPRFFDGEDMSDRFRIKVGDLWSRIIGLIIISLTVLSFVALATRSSPVDAAKVFFVQLSFAATLISWIIVNQQKPLAAQLELLEIDASNSRDELLILVRSIRQNIHSANTKVQSLTQEELNSAGDVLKSFGPLAMMFLRGERNLFKIGFTAVNLAGKALAWFSNSRASSSRTNNSKTE
jgi:hypothetical protein